ncbi:benzoyl-CoA reductase subunit C [Motiliproteus sp. SC1-56]|uniref:benzoyl-CoA reductase subunit C n=1 Tax=Motiliproteus sp. SC1-56 TaxID=2799565 RepID=UPI001A8E77CA|nr:benzoyl-CoA reductase subunit C [Motiliproteus sp. SC1-56]
MSTAEIIKRCEELYEDTHFTAAREWKAADPSRRVIGYMPVYVPREIMHAANMLSLGILGGGDKLEVIHGDAYYQSYICRIPRSTIELGKSGRLDFVDGMLFPSICDVIRNLSGMWKLMFPSSYVRYFDVPQNYKDDVGGNYYVAELQELREGLEKLSGNKITDEALRNSIAIYNINRALIRELYDLRAEMPHNVSSNDVYLLNRAGMVLPVEEHNEILREYMDKAAQQDNPVRDNCRIIINGSFCEQPPLNLIRSVEMAGCYIVDDDYMLINRWLLNEVPVDGDPLENLAKAFLHESADSAAKYCDREEDVGQYLLSTVRERRAEGVIFAAPSFCDPALLERPMLTERMKEHEIPHISFKYAENSGQMQPIREQAGTFADSIKLWS